MGNEERQGRLEEDGGMEWKEKDLSAPEMEEIFVRGGAIFFLLPCVLGSVFLFFDLCIFGFVVKDVGTGLVNQ